MDRARHLSPMTMLLLAALVGVLALAGCGDDSDSEGGGDEAATAPAETTSPADTTEAEAEEEPNDAIEDETAPSGEAVRSAKVEIDDFAYDPATVTIQAGGKVIWLNRDSVPHTATLDDGSFDTGALAEGKLKSQSFKAPGTFAYHCEIHPEMTGTVEVVESG